MIEIRHRLPFALEHLGALLEEIVLRQQNLALIVPGIGQVIALFDDGKHRAYGKTIAPATQSFWNIPAETKSKLAGTCLA